MRVSCETIAEFLECLEEVTKVFDNTVRVSVNTNFVKETKQQVTIKASTVVQTEDGTEYILEAGQHCGFNYTDSSGNTAGTEVADLMKRQIVGICRKKNWRVLPGVISE